MIFFIFCRRRSTLPLSCSNKFGSHSNNLCASPQVDKISLIRLSPLSPTPYNHSCVACVKIFIFSSSLIISLGKKPPVDGEEPIFPMHCKGFIIFCRYFFKSSFYFFNLSLACNYLSNISKIVAEDPLNSSTSCLLEVGPKFIV